MVFSYGRACAPSENAVIWLSPWSVMMYADAVGRSSCVWIISSESPSELRFSEKGAKSLPAHSAMVADSPRSFSVYAMFAPVPPNCTSGGFTRKLTLILWSRSARKWSRNRPGKSMIRSNATDPAIRILLFIDERRIAFDFHPVLAERGRFELPKSFHPCRFSKPVHSTTLPPLQAVRTSAQSRHPSIYKGKNARMAKFRRPHRLTARTAPFHGVNRGSIPRGVMAQIKTAQKWAVLILAHDTQAAFGECRGGESKRAAATAASGGRAKSEHGFMRDRSALAFPQDASSWSHAIEKPPVRAVSLFAIYSGSA